MSRWPHDARAPWGVDARELAWAHEGVARCAPHAQAVAQALEAVPPGAQVDAIAASDLAVLWLQAPPAAVRSLRELKLVAATRCAHLHGGAPADWWVAGDWNTRRPFPCAALPRALVQPLLDACQTRGVRLRWHSVWDVAAAAEAGRLPAQGWCALRTPRRVLLWHCSGGEIDALSHFAAAPDAPRAEIEAAAAMHIQVECAGDAVLAPGAVHWVEAPTSASEALAALAAGRLLGERRSRQGLRLRFEHESQDALPWLFGRRRGVEALAGVALMAVGVSVLAACGWQLVQARQELAGTQAELLALDQRPRAAAPTVTAPKPEQRRAWSQVVRQLNTPWAALLAGLEAATPEDVALVSIEPDARQGIVRLQAEARSLDTLLAYAQALKGVEPFVDVALLKHETNEQDPNRPVRLAMSLRLRERESAAAAIPEAAR